MEEVTVPSAFRLDQMATFFKSHCSVELKRCALQCGYLLL
jgi:hypothetical protein